VQLFLILKTVEKKIQRKTKNISYILHLSFDKILVLFCQLSRTRKILKYFYIISISVELLMYSAERLTALLLFIIT